MKQTVKDILKTGHRQFTQDIEYPETGSEDLKVMVDHLNDAIAEWEAQVLEGYYWSELLVTGSPLVFGGTGTDALPENFLDFYRIGGNPAYIRINSTEYTEISTEEAVRYVLEGTAPGNVFWREGNSIRTMPALSGSITVPYVRLATTFNSGDEDVYPDMRDTMFLKDWITAKLYLDNNDDTLYSQYFNQANEKLEKAKAQYLVHNQF